MCFALWLLDFAQSFLFLSHSESLRSSWHTYYEGTNVVLLIVDSMDRERLPISKQELFKMLSHEVTQRRRRKKKKKQLTNHNQNLRNAKLLVFANKQDLRGAMTVAEISEALGLHTIKDHTHHIQVRRVFLVFLFFLTQLHSLFFCCWEPRHVVH